MNALRWQYVKPLKDSGTITRLASEMGVTLSADLVDCLILNNGGRPDRKSFDTDRAKERVMKSLLSFNKDDRGAAFAVIDALKGVKEKLFPFASDPGGNYLCVNASGEIVLWFHEMNSIEYVASNFEAFISGLYNA